VELGGAEIPVMARQQQFSSSPTGYGTQLNNNLGKFIGINMQIPLFNRMQTKNSVRLAVTNLKGRQLEMENQQLILKQNIEQAYLDMSGAFQRMELLKGQVKNFEESFRAAAIRLESGVLNITEFLISKNNLDRSRINLLQAVYEFQFRTKVLDYYKGTLVP
jgi:outer membrane protein